MMHGEDHEQRRKLASRLHALIKADEYTRKRELADEEKKPERNLAHEALARVLAREIPLLVTANKAQDIANALRLRELDI